MLERPRIHAMKPMLALRHSLIPNQKRWPITLRLARIASKCFLHSIRTVSTFWHRSVTQRNRQWMHSNWCKSVMQVQPRLRVALALNIPLEVQPIFCVSAFIVLQLYIFWIKNIFIPWQIWTREAVGTGWRVFIIWIFRIRLSSVTRVRTVSFYHQIKLCQTHWKCLTALRLWLPNVEL